MFRLGTVAEIGGLSGHRFGVRPKAEGRSEQAAGQICHRHRRDDARAEGCPGALDHIPAGPFRPEAGCALIATGMLIATDMP